MTLQALISRITGTASPDGCRYDGPRRSRKHSNRLSKFLIFLAAPVICRFSLNQPNISCFETIIYLGRTSVYTSIKLGGHHGSENQVLHFLRK